MATRTRDRHATVWVCVDCMYAHAGIGEEERGEPFQYGETFVRDSYFEDYAQQLAEDIGAIPDGAGWPLTCIDWQQAARELRMDYTCVEVAGVTFWARG